MEDAHPDGVLDGREGHVYTPKSCCPLRCTLLISRKSEKSYAYPSLLCASFTAAVPGTIITIKALRITFNSCNSSMALATVNINNH